MNNKCILLMLLACSTALVHAQRKPKIKGNRNITEVRESLPPFHSVKLEDDLEIILESAASPGYTISADDNLIDILKLRVDADTLYISSFYTVTAKKKLEIRVQYNQLNAITLDNGSLSTENIVNTDALTVRGHAAARLQLNAKCGLLRLHMNEQSAGDFNLETDSLLVNLSNRAEARIYMTGGETGAVLEDESDAVFEGTAHTLDLRMNSGAELMAERLMVDSINVDLEGSSKAHLRPSKQLVLSSRGSANSYLYGDAEIMIRQFDDTSVLYKRRD